MQPVSANEATDGELIVRTGDGDRDAFEELYRRYARPVFGLALRRLGDRGRAEDAVQETFAVDLALGPHLPARARGRRRRGSTPSRATRSSTAAARRASRRSRRPTRPRTEPGPTERPRQGWIAWRIHRALEELPEQRAQP